MQELKQKENKNKEREGVEEMEQTVTTLQTNEEIINERANISIINEFKKVVHGIGPYFICFNGISGDYRPYISISHIKGAVIEELERIYEHLEEFYENRVTRKQVKWLLENRTNDLIDLEVNYQINVFNNILQKELEDIDIEEILKENKTKLLGEIKNKKIKEIVEQEFEDIIKAISVEIRSNPIRLVKVDKIINERGKFKLCGQTIELKGDYKTGILILKNEDRIKLKKISESPCKDSYLVKRYNVICYLIENITQQFIELEDFISFDYYLENYLWDVAGDIECISNEITQKQIWDLQNFNLDIYG